MNTIHLRNDQNIKKYENIAEWRYLPAQKSPKTLRKYNFELNSKWT